MSLLLHRFFAANAAGGPSGYYYKMSTVTQYYAPSFGGTRPLAGGGWVIAGSRPNDIRFIATLASNGVLTSYKQTSPVGFLPEIHSMSVRNQFADGRMSVALYDKIGYISTSQSYTGTPCKLAQPSGIMCNDDATNVVFAAYSTGGGYSPREYHVNAINSSGSTYWVKKWGGSGYEFGGGPGRAFIRPGDTTNMWVNVATGNSVSLWLFDKSTGIVNGAYSLTNQTIGTGMTSVITDPSGNIYFSNNVGKILRVNANNTYAWGFIYAQGAQAFDTTHICFYNGYIYGLARGTYLFKLNPANGSLVWLINITGGFNGYNISAGPDGIMTSGGGGGGSGFESTYLLNYPLDAGILGTRGALSFAVGSASLTAISGYFETTAIPALQNSVVAWPNTYTESLVNSSSLMGSKTTI